MDHTTTGIAGRTRGRAASLASASLSSSPFVNRGPPRVRFRSPERCNVVFVLDGDDEGGAGARDGGEERRGRGAAEGRRPPLEDLPVASRTRSKLSSVDAVLESQSLFGGKNPADGGPPVFGDDGEMETSGGRGPRSAGVPPYVGRRIQAKMSSLGAALVVSDSGSSEEEEEEPPPLPVSGSGANAGGTIAGGGGGGEGPALPVKRKRFCGIDVLIPPGGSSSTEEPGIAKRTRSHFAPESRVQWQQQPGTLSSPYCVDMDSSEPDSESNSSSSCSDHDSSEDDGDGSIHLHGFANGDGAAEVEGNAKQGKPKLWKPRGRWKRGRRPLAAGNNDVFTVLLDDILQKDGKPREDLKPRELPLVFSFGDEGPRSPALEKSEYEEALDGLWSEFDFALRVDELGSGCDYVGEDDEIKMSGTEAIPSGLCSQGNHKLILDEQIGVVCQLCSFVELEIRYVPPSFETGYFSAKPNKKTLREEDISMLKALGNETADDKFDSPMVETKGTIWDVVDPGVKGNLFPHQREGLEFIWKNMAGDILIEKVKNSVSSNAVGGGCVITHAPGTGKTRLAIVFLQTFLRLFPRCRPVVLAPRGMLLTWGEEFKRCKVGFPFHVLNDKQKPQKSSKAINGIPELYLQRGGAPMTKSVGRLLKLHSWATRGDGVLGISYGLFERLAGNSDKGPEEEKLSRILLEQPGLFVFDEGHTPRNERSGIWKALQKIRTRCRVILSGTPFQNNLRELENVLCLVRPELSGKVSSRAPKTCSQQRENVFSHDSIEELRSLIRPFVHLHSGSVLDGLPGLRDCLILLNPPCHQRDLLERFQRFPRGNYLDHQTKASCASVHPSLLASAKLSGEEESTIGEQLLQTLRDEKLLLNPNEGVKTRFVTELVRLSGSLGEKVLVFGEYIEPLSLIRKQLLKVFGWGEGKVLTMDGSIFLEDRQSYIDAFNDPGSEVQVLLASIRACCEGISLVGASRVVLLDTVWNPSRERQAISRAYRLGQKRVVYTYHLITTETGEFVKYQRQAEKDRLSKLLFSSQSKSDPGEEEDGGPSWVPEDRILKEMREHEKLKDMFKHVVDKRREALLLDPFDPLLSAG